MSIFDEISALLAKEKAEGRQVHHVYLGRNQWRSMEIWAYKNAYLNNPKLNRDEPVEVEGIKCYSVNTDSMLDVSCKVSQS